MPLTSVPPWLEEQGKSSGSLTAVIANPGDGLANMKEKVLVLAEQ